MDDAIAKIYKKNIHKNVNTKIFILCQLIDFYKN